MIPNEQETGFHKFVKRKRLLRRRRDEDVDDIQNDDDVDDDDNKDDADVEDDHLIIIQSMMRTMFQKRKYNDLLFAFADYIVELLK